jgi:gamma-glutamylcyclotransferase (GGCT)/AIG2-like uncharacterized protein YtfP
VSRTGTLVFVYGSNLDQAQMKLRCPGHVCIGRARLVDHRLCFPRFSRNRGCCVASIEAAPGEEVWGAVYDLGEADLAALDRFEGCLPGTPGNSYERVPITVELDDRLLAVETYVANAGQAGHPNRAYRRHLVEGALSWRLPAGYVAGLRAIPTSD